MRLLILAGTTEATDLGRALAGEPRVQATMSLAGRTLRPAAQPLPVRIGGFGGVDGLCRYVTAQRIDALIDATHPFAAQMTAHAVAAAQITGVRLLVISRPAWTPVSGDRWTMVASMQDAAETLGAASRRVFLTVGQKDLRPFQDTPHHFLLRSVDPPPPEILPADVTCIAARGPFDEDAEIRLLTEHRIDVVVTKNSGGSATAAKLSAARRLNVPVIMVERPPPPQAETVASVADALTWLHAAVPRGV